MRKNNSQKECILTILDKERLTIINQLKDYWKLICHSNNALGEINKNLFFTNQNKETSTFELMQHLVCICTGLGSLLDYSNKRYLWDNLYKKFRESGLKKNYILLMFPLNNVPLLPIIEDEFYDSQGKAKGVYGIKACVWWKAYNSIKHEFSYMESATLNNTLNALYGSLLFALYCYIELSKADGYFVHPDRVIELTISDQPCSPHSTYVQIPKNVRFQHIQLNTHSVILGKFNIKGLLHVVENNPSIVDPLSYHYL